jgi:hypothetical protein
VQRASNTLNLLQISTGFLTAKHQNRCDKIFEMPRAPKLFKEKTAVVSVRFPLSLKKQLEKLAEKNRRSLNQQILLMLEARAQEEKLSSS